jgi:hypothetical protein
MGKMISDPVKVFEELEPLLKAEGWVMESAEGSFSVRRFERGGRKLRLEVDINKEKVEFGPAKWPHYNDSDGSPNTIYSYYPEGSNGERMSERINATPAVNISTRKRPEIILEEANRRFITPYLQHYTACEKVAERSQAVADKAIKLWDDIVALIGAEPTKRRHGNLYPTIVGRGKYDVHIENRHGSVRIVIDTSELIEVAKVLEAMGADYCYDLTPEVKEAVETT